MKFTPLKMHGQLTRSVRTVYNYPNPCDTCKACVHSDGCSKWQMRFRTIWKQFNTYPLRQYRKAPTAKKFCYEHPDTARKYLSDGPCKGCKIEKDCENACGAYYQWWDARIAWLKHRWGMEK